MILSLFLVLYIVPAIICIVNLWPETDTWDDLLSLMQLSFLPVSNFFTAIMLIAEGTDEDFPERELPWRKK